MLALIYRIILAVISLSDLVGENNRKSTHFKRVVLELVVYPMVLIGITVWLVWLIINQDVHLLDLPSVIAIVGAQEVVIDVIVTRVSKKIGTVAKDAEQTSTSE